MNNYTRFLILITSICLLALSLSVWCLNVPVRPIYQLRQIEPTLVVVVPPEIPKEESVEELIIRLSEEAGFESKTVVRIATCESQLGKYRKNWEGSSATGIFMFMPKTFDYYCEGNINDDESQVKCFLKLYPTKKSWWLCK